MLNILFAAKYKTPVILTATLIADVIFYVALKSL